MGRELVPAMEEGRSHERSSVAPGPLRAHVLGLAEEEEAEAAARGGREERTLFGAGRCLGRDAGPYVSAVKLQRSQGWAGRRTKANVALKKLSTLCSFYLSCRRVGDEPNRALEFGWHGLGQDLDMRCCGCGHQCPSLAID
jgi:hypothetical protein